jgi:hypothetical protein
MENDRSEKGRDVWLARNWTKGTVFGCLAKKEKFELIRFLHDRYHERFFSPIRSLRRTSGNEQGYGFAIMALCCLLIETIQCYREGFPSSSYSDLNYMQGLPLNNEDVAYKLVEPWPANESEGMFKRFFKDNRYFPSVDGEVFYKKIRCGLLHQAQTKGPWRIVRSGKYWDDSQEKKSINRDEFTDRLQEYFEDYLSRLRNGEWDEPIWKVARRKIWWLVQLS